MWVNLFLIIKIENLDIIIKYRIIRWIVINNNRYYRIEVYTIRISGIHGYLHGFLINSFYFAMNDNRNNVKHTHTHTRLPTIKSLPLGHRGDV